MTVPTPEQLAIQHADEKGEYDNIGFRYRGNVITGPDGAFRFRTIVPALYSGRTRHYHVKVQAPRSRLVPSWCSSCVGGRHIAADGRASYSLRVCTGWRLLRRLAKRPSSASWWMRGSTERPGARLAGMPQSRHQAVHSSRAKQCIALAFTEFFDTRSEERKALLANYHGRAGQQLNSSRQRLN